MQYKRTPKEQIIWKMQNVLRGQAMFIKEDTISSASDRLIQMQVIQSLKDFIDNFDEYNQVLQDYKKNKNKMEIERE